MNRMRRTFTASLSMVFVAVFATLATVAALSYRNAQTLVATSAWISHTNEVIIELDITRREITRIRRAQMAYATGKVKIDVYPPGALDDALKLHVERLRELMSDNSSQLATVARLEQIIARRPAGDPPILLPGPLRHNAWENEMEHTQKIVDLLDHLKSEEDRLLRERAAHQDGAVARTIRMITIFVGIAFLVFVVLYWVLLRNGKEREKIEKALAASEALYRDLFDNTSELIHMVSPEGRFLFTNQTWQRTLKYGPDEIPNLHVKDVVHPEDWPYFEGILKRLIEGETIEGIKVRLRANDGQVIYIEGHSSYRFVDRRPMSTRGIYRNVTERKFVEVELQAAQESLQIALAKEQELSRVDSLTSIPNRRAFYEMLDVERRRAKRYGRPLTLAYMDLDNFKQVNDTRGHSEGDQLLSTVATTMRSTLRATDFIGRIGGDEFAILLPETDAFASKTVLIKLQTVLQDAMVGHDWDVTFSIGAATFLSPLESIEGMMQIADNAMYSVKKKGKNKVSVSILG